MNFVFWAIPIIFLGMACAALWHLQWLRRLPAFPETKSAARSKLVRCSIVIAARDEESRIEQTIRRLLQQQGIEIEIIIVDDRSVDRTASILSRLIAEDPRIKTIRVEQLPEGWLGKCHACHLGAEAATGEWILFTDADCWLKPDVIARALAVADEDQADHITMAPGTTGLTFAAKGWYLFFLTSLTSWFSGANRDNGKSYIGIRAFNMVRATAYRQCGGYEALRLTIIDDVKLGMLLRRAGKRTRGFLGADDLECHWGRTVGDLVKIMEKNYFATVNFNFGLVIAGCSFVGVFIFLIIAALVSGTAIGLAAAFSPLLTMVPASILAKRVGWSFLCAMAMPFMFPVFIYALLNSTYVTLRHGGVRWRDTFYPLAVLRAGNVR